MSDPAAARRLESESASIERPSIDDTRSGHREWAAGIVLAGLVGSIVDWLIVSVPAIALTRWARFSSAAAGGVALVGVILLAAATTMVGSALRSADILYTLIWFAPIAVVAIPLTTWVASRTGRTWRTSAIVGVASFDLVTVLLMWFGLPRV